MILLSPVETPARKTEICNLVLRSLPDWFGIEESLLDYTRDVQPMSFWAAMDGDAPVGFAALKVHNACTAEMYVMGVLPSYHRQGIGRRLIAQCVQASRAQGLGFLTVKTLDASAGSEPYDRTRAFYLEMGFLPVEVFPDLWGPQNPCLLLLMPL